MNLRDYPFSQTEVSQTGGFSGKRFVRQEVCQTDFCQTKKFSDKRFVRQEVCQARGLSDISKMSDKLFVRQTFVRQKLFFASFCGSVGLG